MKLATTIAGSDVCGDSNHEIGDDDSVWVFSFFVCAADERVAEHEIEIRGRGGEEPFTKEHIKNFMSKGKKKDLIVAYVVAKSGITMVDARKKFTPDPMALGDEEEKEEETMKAPKKKGTERKKTEESEDEESEQVSFQHFSNMGIRHVLISLSSH